MLRSIFNNESLLDSYRGTQASVPNENYLVPGIEEANEGKETHNQLKNDVLEESSRVFNQDFVSKDGQDSEVLLAENSTEVLPGLSKESMNDDLKLDSSSSFNTPAEQQESYSNENSTREIEEISETIQVKEVEGKKKRSRGRKEGAR